jgi:hypothetical protein
VDTGVGGAPDTAEPADTGAPPPDCPTFGFVWRAPLAGALHIEGEVQAADGGVVLDWDRLTDSVVGNEVRLEMEVCTGAAFRGEGIADVDGDGLPDAWSCTRQADGSFSLTGDVRFSWDGASLSTQVVSDPTSDGCGVFAAFPVAR